MIARVWAVIGPGFNSIIIEKENVIVRADPDLEWTIDKRIEWFKQVCEAKKWRLEEYK